VIAIGVNWGNSRAANSESYLVNLTDNNELQEYRENFQTIYNSLLDESESIRQMKALLQKTFGFQNAVPSEFVLHQNYPNPFNPKTVISYQLPVFSEVELNIYNILGQKVSTLVSEMQPAGVYKIEWDASVFASGVYFYRLKTAKGFIKTQKMLLIK